MVRAAVPAAQRAAAAAALCAAVLCAVVTSAARVQTVPSGDDGKSESPNDLNLDPSSEYTSCKAKNGDIGVCLRFDKCDDNQTVILGGIILQNELREADPFAALRAPDNNRCPEDHWCCTGFNSTRSNKPSSTPTLMQHQPGLHADCVRHPDASCPWCVALYRPGGDVAYGQTSASGLYCAGSLVGANVVLTSGSCIRTVANEVIWARVPAAASPARRYAITNKIIHEHYNSGTHANDFGLLVLNESVAFQRSPAGACLSLRAPLRGHCFVVGFNNQDEIVTAALTVRKGGCGTRRRNISDLTCGEGASGRCAAAPGAPVLCPLAADRQGGLAVAGVVRRTCKDGAAELGELQQHTTWLQLKLTQLGVPELQYAV